MDETRFLDMINWVKKRKQEKSTDFLEPPVLAKLIKMVEKERDVQFLSSGGYEGAERQLVVLYPDFLSEDEIDVPIGAIEITADFKKENITHRDVLGSIIALGIKREKVGDILINDNKCQAIIRKDIISYVTHNLTRVGKVNVHTTEIDINQIMPAEKKLKEIEAVVASLRLDSIASVAFSTSRTKMQDFIKSGFVRVNWVEVSDPAYIVKEGDTLSFRGHGRAIFDSIKGTTKKDRIAVSIKKYI